MALAWQPREADLSTPATEKFLGLFLLVLPADDKSANVVPKVGVPDKQLSERVSNLINSDFKYFILYSSILYMNRLDIE